MIEVVNSLERTLKLDDDLCLKKLELTKYINGDGSHGHYVMAYFNDTSCTKIELSTKNIIDEIVNKVYNGKRVYTFDKDRLIEELEDIEEEYKDCMKRSQLIVIEQARAYIECHTTNDDFNI